MKIGIIVYSQTGNTYSVATKLKEELLRTKKDVEIERIEANRENRQGKQYNELKKVPDPNKYDVIIFASYVEAFSLCKVMEEYFKNIKSLKNKKILCFVTEAFPYPWMGGNHAIKQIKGLIEEKGATTSITGIINWKSKHRAEMIENLVKDFCKEIS